MSELETFRSETRAWLEANCPPEMRQPLASEQDICWGGRKWTFQSEAQRVWLERMAAKGWTAPEWPKQYGGGGLNREEAKVLRAEMRALGCRSPLDSFGLWMLGPALLKYGSEAQKLHYLPQITRGEIRWCQGYSEPNAGSDLASLQTRAEDKGDHFLVNGQKIWTSYADKADWIFCLVRTDFKAPKHEGISFILFDMETPGVSTKPITLISGKSPFCETFFDNVKVPKENLVGQLNKGWDVAKYLLSHERDMIGGIGDRHGARPLGQFAAHLIGANADGSLAEPALRAEIAAFEVDEAAFRCAMERAGDLVKAGQGHPAFSSVLKYYGTELNKRRNELLMAAGGADALEWESARSKEGAMARDWLRSKANSIEGGTSEIQLNIVSKRLLGAARCLSCPIKAFAQANTVMAGSEVGPDRNGLLQRSPVKIIDSAGNAMPLLLNDEQTMMRDSVRGFIAEHAPVSHLRKLRDTRDETGFSRELWARFADMGLCGVLVPDAFGGQGLGNVEAGIVMEEIGRNLTPSPFLSTALLGATALLRAGSSAQQAEHLPKIAAGSLIAALAIDEGGKHRPAATALSAKRSGNGFKLDGAKSFVVDGHVADLLIVAARTAGAPGEQEGMTLFLVDRKAAGIEVERTVMVDAHNAARLTFRSVEVTADAVLGEVDQGFDALEGILNVGRAAVSAELVGVGEESFGRTLDYLKQRKQFGKPIGQFQALQHRAAHLYSELEITRAAVLKALQTLDESPDKAGPAVAVAKARACRTVNLAVQEGVQMHGGIGMTDEFDIGLFMKRARVGQELFGDANFHASRLAYARGY